MLGPHPRDSTLGPANGTKTEDRARESCRGIGGNRRGGRISLGIVMHTALARNNAGPLSLMRPSCFLRLAPVTIALPPYTLVSTASITGFSGILSISRGEEYFFFFFFIIRFKNFGKIFLKVCIGIL